ncbi:hypothetical protein MTP99_005794 [Tenebrio molitor]|jgi:hypothetical protein|nr:hypothetical protein MTP99_005794 [Tenebrio molitor]
MPGLEIFVFVLGTATLLTAHLVVVAEIRLKGEEWAIKVAYSQQGGLKMSVVIAVKGETGITEDVDILTFDRNFVSSWLRIPASSWQWQNSKYIITYVI